MQSLHWPRKLAAAAVLSIAALAQTAGAVQLVWIPEPLEKYCLGKTHEQCASMDFCIRTTTRNVSTCRNLALDLAHLPAYERTHGLVQQL
jgi:hypothetical protein